jgi:hypothetical protein
MAEFAQHLEHAARDLMLALDRLIGIGVGAKRDDRAFVFGMCELGAQQLGRFEFREQPRLEVEPGREAEIGVRRPRKAVDAAMLAAPVRVDRLLEGNVGRVVARDDAARLIGRDRGGDGRRIAVLFLRPPPAIIDRLARLPIEARLPPPNPPL